MSSVTEWPVAGPPSANPEGQDAIEPATIPDARARLVQAPGERPFVDDPWSLYRRLHRRPGPVFWSDYGFWCLKEHAAVDAALRDRRLKRLPPPADTPPPWPAHLSRFAASERHSLLALEGAAHTRLRKFATRAFMSREIRKLEPGIRALAHARVDAMQAAGHAELIGDYATPIPVTVIARLLGVPDQRSDDLRRWSSAMVRVYTMTQSREEEDAAERAADAFIDCIEQLIAERRARPQDDLISHLLALQAQPDALLDEEIVSSAILLLNAGHEATVHQLGNGVLTLLEHPVVDQRERFATAAQRDATVLELTRYRAPLHLFVRYAQEPMRLPGGIAVAAGERIGLLLGAANRDPVRFTRADEFLPERTDGASLAFGAGVHFCLGVQLARLELGIALQVLFERLPGLRLASPVRFADTYHFHGLEALPVSW